MQKKDKKKPFTVKEAALLAIYRKPGIVRLISERHKRRLEKLKGKMEVVG